jgi:hypothetical protein
MEIRTVSLEDQFRTEDLLRKQIAMLQKELGEASTAERAWYEAASPYATPEALKAALAVRPEGGAQVAYEKGLEDAASLCDARFKVINEDTSGDTEYFYLDELENAAKAIRRLKSRGNPQSPMNSDGATK